ncbi:hypothetical protein M2323_001371 [Rhodoblastus acidophilus]|nr:hypothetical protein [Rhodoblastus acidophilus]MCW2332459.1 hypothetical protein [Rhodoblastus acidophilus]
MRGNIRLLKNPWAAPTLAGAPETPAKAGASG